MGYRQAGLLVLQVEPPEAVADLCEQVDVPDQVSVGLGVLGEALGLLRGIRAGEAWLVGSPRRDTARVALLRAAAGAVALEAAPLLAEISALALRGRIDLPSGAPAARPRRPERKLPISDRELEVLVLIAKGLTNKEIASELFISERTAAHHVGHIFDKLGVSSRVEAAGIAHQAGVLTEATAAD